MASFINGNIKFNKELRTKADGLQVLQIIDKSTGEEVKLGVTVTWEEINGQIIIKHITGLKPEAKYFVRLLVI